MRYTWQIADRLFIIGPVGYLRIICKRCRLLYFLGHFSAGEDPMALESAENAIEAALIDPEPAF